MSFHLYQIDEIFTNADGTQQYIELSTTANGQNLLSTHTITVTQNNVVRTFTFPSNLPSASTANTKVLLATQGFITDGIITPDYIIPDGFLFTTGGTLNFGGGFSVVVYAQLPTDESHAVDAAGNVVLANPTNFRGDDVRIAEPGDQIYQLGNGNDTVFFESTVTNGVLSWNNGFDTIISTDGGIAAPNFDTIALESAVDYVFPRKAGNHFELSLYAQVQNGNLDPGTGALNGEIGRITLQNAFSANPADRISRITGANGFYFEAIATPAADLYGHVAIYKSHEPSPGTPNVLYGESFVDINNHDTQYTEVFANGNGQVEYYDADNNLAWSSIRLVYNGYGTPNQALVRSDRFNDNGTVDVFASGTAFNDSIDGNNGDDTLNGLSGMDLLNGLAGNDTLRGGEQADTLLGGVGDDYLNGGKGTDSLDGGAGNDTLVGALGTDLLIGGDGIDIADYSGSTDGVAVNLGLAGAQQVSVATGLDTLAQIENLIGSNFNDTLTGDAGNNSLTGLLGNDVLTGLDGFDSLDGGTGDDNLNGGINADTLVGGAGNDFLSGGKGTDSLDGGDGNDSLSGGLGTDRLTGGAGADRFTFRTALDGTFNIDTLTDFVSGVDLIELSAVIFGAFAGQVGNTVGTGANLTYNNVTGVLAYDADGAGDGAPVTFAVLGTSSHPPSVGLDFLIVA